ncbi:MAG: glutamine synthetase III [Eubacteriales bacterium]|nr:glutamine synthetase III [Eubacteriales bacterium]
MKNKKEDKKNKFKKDFVPTCFAEYVFSDSEMKKYLPLEIYKKVKRTIDKGEELDPSLANVVAKGMKEWAIEKGATHYTHWFQPLTEATAEKHNAFISRPKDGKVIMEFSGSELIKGEADASSFPTGGIRATFEARGYTEWDATSPVFIRKDEKGASLCIPTAFVAYGGQSLDGKTPLLRSMEVLNTQALRILKLFGNKKTKRVRPVVGIEQEYFLIDREQYLKREDLIHTGRTLFGLVPPKTQQLDDHYYGSIRAKIGQFMDEVNKELWKMGVPAKTHHNEVAPAQHELACVYEDANISVDHNQIVMETLKKVASRYDMVCLLFEKPFEYINGSGKHNNWSLETDDGINLLKPGDHLHENYQFLLILSCILKAIDEYAPLLRASVANVGNDHRLGASEAPPAIISCFLGDQLEDVINQIIDKGLATSSKKGTVIKMGVKVLPELDKDVTDRNRTSPFAFTGNKFEFRMVGSSQSCAFPMTVLNTIVSNAFCEACDVLEKSKDFNKDIAKYIRENLTNHKRIIFNGNGYSNEWREEAKRRGLANLPNMVSCIPEIVKDSTIKLFEKYSIFTKEELESRKEIEYEKYFNAINIECETMQRMARKLYLPIIIKYSKEVCDSIISLKALDKMICEKDNNLSSHIECEDSVEMDILKSITKGKNDIKKYLNLLEEKSKACLKINDIEKKAIAYRDEIVPLMNKLREEVDEIEYYVYKKVWPVPSYSELLFEVSKI